MKRSVVNSGFLPPKEEKPTMMVGSLGRSPVRSSVGYNADYLFRRLGLPRYAEVDSELIFRLADRFAPEGPIDQEGLKKALALCRGQMSAVLTSRLDPGTITVLKGNKPLCLRIHRQHRVVLYASDDAFIDFAVVNEKGWRELEVPPMTMLTIRHEDVRAIENSEFRFIPQERKGTS